MSAQEPVLPASTSAGGTADAASSAASAPSAAAASSAASAPSAAPPDSPGCLSLFVSSLREKFVALKDKKKLGATSSSSSLLKPPRDWSPKKIAASNPPSKDIVLSVVPTKQKRSKKTNGDVDDESPIVVRISRVGAAVRSLVLPDGTDIVLGSDDTMPYLDGSLPYFGVVVGRVANRIAGASFPLPSGERVTLPANDAGRHCLHGGVVGWDKREWSVVGGGGAPSSSVSLSLSSSDGEEGFPGNVEATVRYSLCPERGSLRIEFSASTDKPTAVAMTQHTYFNLDDAGDARSPRTVLGHTLQIDASTYLPKNEGTGVPDGRLESVEECPFLDFRKPKKIGGAGVGGAGGGGDAEAGRGAFAGGRRGYDDCYAVDGYKGRGHVRRAAILTSGTNERRSVEVWTDARGMQFYSAGYCGTPRRVRGKGGELHGPYAGAALETHAFPNGVNVEDEQWKRDMLLLPGEEYRHVVEWRFSW